MQAVQYRQDNEISYVGLNVHEGWRRKDTIPAVAVILGSARY
jgi:hypothetical protein